MESQKDAPRDAGRVAENFGIDAARGGGKEKPHRSDVTHSVTGIGGEGDTFDTTLTPEAARNEARKSSRANLGVPPALFVPGSQTEKRDRVTVPQKAGNEKRGEEIRPVTTSTPGPPSTSQSRRTSNSGASKSKRSSASARERKRREIELREAEELLRIEEEEAKRQLERKKELVRIQAERKLAEIDEESSEEDISEDIIEDQQSVCSKVRSWISRQRVQEESRGARNTDERIYSPNPRNPCNTGPPEAQNEREGVRLGERIKSSNSPNPGNDSGPENRLDRYLARQIMGKDLPNFNGEVTEWPLFIGTYRQSTLDCGYSQNENVTRLRRSLKGEALEAVRALLMTSQADKIIEILERRFGRPEYVIQSLMRTMTEIPKKRDDKPESIVKFATAVTNLVATIQALDKPDYLVNPLLTDQLIQKLSAGMKHRWGERVNRLQISGTLTNFGDFLDEESRTVSAYYNPLLEGKQGKESRPVLTLEDNNDHKGIKCAYCAKDHAIGTCGNFRKMDTDSRWKWAMGERVCFKCLSKKHLLRQCKRKQCGKNGCKRAHHPLLHFERRDTVVPEKVPNAETANTSDENVNVVRKVEKRVLMMIVPVTLEGPEGKIKTHAFLDSGSTVTIIRSDLARKLGLQGYSDPLRSKWMNKMTYEDKTSRRVSVIITGDSKSYPLKDIRTLDDLELPSHPLDMDVANWDHLRDLDLPNTAGVAPEILIGEDYATLKVALKVIVGKPNAPVATHTPLGWAIHGSFTTARTNNECVMMIYHNEDEEEISHLLKNFWSVESFGVDMQAKVLRSKEDIRAEDILNHTARKLNDRWETGLLWKSDSEVLPPSYKMSEKRFSCLENKMRKEALFQDLYEKKIEEYLAKGYARILSATEEKDTNARTWYIPHFAATNPNKPGKIRLIFDAAAKSQGVSLNDRLLKGPDLYNSLVGILSIFRERAIGICGDLREMFHQVKIREEDKGSQRFLWRDKETGKMITCQMEVMIFGAISSPYIAQELKNRNAKEYEEQFPEACRAILERHYMDDYLDSVDTTEDTIRKAKEVSYIHRKGGFEIRNWVSNSQEFLSSLPPDAVAPRSGQISFGEEDFARVLGMIWSPESDIFTFSANFPRLDSRLLNGEKQPTKREVLKLIMSVFDPLGLLAIMTIWGKILMQDIWTTGLDWDTVLPEELTTKWRTWLADLKEASKLRIPRCYSFGIGKLRDVQLHIFCDASVQAFAAVGYFRLEGEMGTRTTLVMAKSRVAPLKHMRIPRLELQAAVMGSRLAQTITSQHSLKISRKILWTDSQNVIKWIRSDSRRYPPFVAHRIAEILDLTSVLEWRWILTKENVADDATRDTSHIEVSQTSRWFTGPEFLIHEDEKWPKEPLSVEFSEEAKKEIKKEYILLIGEPKEPPFDFSRFSSWTRLIRTMAWVLRFIRSIRKRSRNEEAELSAQEIKKGEIEILKLTQASDFPQDLKLLRHGEKIQPTSKLIELSPKIGDDRLLRMHGRIRNSEISQAVRESIILNGANPVVRLLIHHHHEKAGHIGRERVVNDLRTEYWITKLRTAVRTVFNNCQLCKVRKAKPQTPKMAPLPNVRTEMFVKPFTNTGVDYFGPMEVTIGRRHEKGYGVLFTCLNIRAVHLEIASSLSTDSMIMALRRMMARRGKPKTLYSDNGKNFVGASRELREALEEFDQEEIQRQLATQKIEWHFIPPGSPHMGGCWERLVGSVKRALKATLTEQRPREEVLQTVFAEAEYSVNSRPLTFVSDDPDDAESLTPNHFLLMWNGQYENHGAPGIFQPDGSYLRKQWRKSQTMADLFWKRWVREYLPPLNRRTKWYRRTTNLNVGDLVVIWDNQLPRNQWLRGVISAVYPGKDNQVRVADVRTKTGTYRRPATKICVLEKQDGIPT